jgi:hypothetical protein
MNLNKKILTGSILIEVLISIVLFSIIISASAKLLSSNAKKEVQRNLTYRWNNFLVMVSQELKNNNKTPGVYKNPFPVLEKPKDLIELVMTVREINHPLKMKEISFEAQLDGTEMIHWQLYQ